jgi:hypothetical protein
MASEVLEKYLDEIIYHQIVLERYKTGQGKKILSQVKKTNNDIRALIEKAKGIETKEKYKRITKQIKVYTLEMADILKDYMKKELSALVSTEIRWQKDASPVALEKSPEQDAVVNTILFDTFSDNDTIDSYFDTLGERIYKIWDGQLRIAYTTGITSKDIIKTVLGV